MGKRILVLDDDADLLELMEILLHSCGYETRTLNSGEALFKNIDDFHPNLILMDVMLAGLDGRVLCRDIKFNLEYKMPVILISGTHNLSQVMLEEGSPDDFIAKPFDLDELLKKIGWQLDQ